MNSGITNRVHLNMKWSLTQKPYWWIGTEEQDTIWWDYGKVCIYIANLPTWSLLLSRHLYLKFTFSCPVIENFIWIEHHLRCHLSYKVIWPLFLCPKKPQYSWNTAKVGIKHQSITLFPKGDLLIQLWL